MLSTVASNYDNMNTTTDEISPLLGRTGSLRLKKDNDNNYDTEMNNNNDNNNNNNKQSTTNNNKIYKLFTTVQLIKSLQVTTISERKNRKLHKSNVGAAAFLIRDAVLGIDNVENPATTGIYDPYNTKNDDNIIRNYIAIICQRYSHNVWFIRLLHITIIILIILTFIEPPNWCRAYNDPYRCNTIFSMTGIVASNNNNDDDDEPIIYQYYPNTNSVLLTIYQSHIIEWVCLLILGIILLVRIGRDGLNLQCYLRTSHVQYSRIIQLISWLILIIGLLLETITGNNIYTILHAYFRLLFFMSIIRTSHKDYRVLFNMLPKVLNILLLLLVITIFYAWFGVVMFVDTTEGDVLFPSLIESLWTLWICVTTANYPDVMMPGYNENRWVAIYFVTFMIISFFFLMNVILASVVNEYDTAIQQHRQAHQDQATENFKKAYKLLAKEEKELKIKEEDDGDINNDNNNKDNNNDGSVLQRSNSSSVSSTSIDRKTVMSLFSILNTDFPEFRTLSDDDTKLLFAILDRDGSSKITEDEFMDFGNVLLLEFVKATVYESYIQRTYPNFYNSIFWQKFCYIIKTSTFEYIIDFILFLNAFVVAIQSWPELSDETVILDSRYWDGHIDTAWEVAETIFTVIYTIEAICKIAVLGWHEYKDEIKNVFDFVVTIMAVISSIIVYYPNQYSNSRLIRMILTARVLRLIRLLTIWKPFQLLGKISAEILPAATSVITILLSCMYFYAALGMHLYGGMISRDPNNPLSYKLLDSEFAQSEYWANNFNDMIGGMNVLFNLLVVNNWFVCELGYEAVTQGKWVRYFFLSFHILGVILVNNLVIAFIINKFLQQLTIFGERTGLEVVGGGEAIIGNRRAVFDGSEVTGTKTFLSGRYIARLRHANSYNPDDHHHDRLRALFTQTSSDHADSEGRSVHSVK